MYCVLQKDIKKDGECFYCKKMINLWGDKHVYPDLNIMQHIYISKYPIASYKYMQLYVSIKKNRHCENENKMERQNIHGENICKSLIW
jgi:hypothetical protein